MDEEIIFITWKDLSYPSDRDGGVSFFEEYIQFLLHERWKKVHYITALWYSWWEWNEDKFQFQSHYQPEDIPWFQLTRLNIDASLQQSDYKQAQNKFQRRLLVSAAEMKEMKDIDFYKDSIVRIHIFHVSHAISLVLQWVLPLHKVVLHPMMTWVGYRNYTEVPDEYIEQERQVFERIHMIQTPSIHEAKYLVDDYSVSPEKIMINPRWFNDTVFQKKERTLPETWEVIRILCANMIRSQKGQHNFIAFAQHCQWHWIRVNIQLIWVGNSSYDPEYRAYYRTLRNGIWEKWLDAYFSFFDVMEPGELNAIMSESHVSILPSEYETFGKSALESLATWLPTIVFSDVPAFQEYIVHDMNGMIVERDSDMKNLFDNFLHLISSSDLYTTLSRRWIESGWQYGWNVLFHKMEQDITLKISQVCL